MLLQLLGADACPLAGMGEVAESLGFVFCETKVRFLFSQEDGSGLDDVSYLLHTYTNISVPIQRLYCSTSEEGAESHIIACKLQVAPTALSPDPPMRMIERGKPPFSLHSRII